ncbi:EamA domain-containing protein, partial [Cephalotus follicularis]
RERYFYKGIFRNQRQLYYNFDGLNERGVHIKGVTTPANSDITAMDDAKTRRGYAWAISAGLNAALAAISAKLFESQILRYGMILLFNVTMWGCYVNSLKALSSLQATVTNFATNFLTSGLAGFILFEEALSVKWFAGAILMVIGVLILSKSSIERKASVD